MGIAADLVEFFYPFNQDFQEGLEEQPRKSLKDFCDSYKRKHSNYGFDVVELVFIVQQLVSQGLLIHTGTLSSISPPLGNTYYTSSFDAQLAAYGSYDFASLGFPEIRNFFAKSVQAVVVIKKDDSPDIGSGFLLEDRIFITARHCIEDMKNVIITGWDASLAPLVKLWVPKDERVDLAALRFDGDPFPGIAGFRIQSSDVLDDVLTMGYPPIPGFESPLVTEKAQIAGHLKSTTGQVVAREKAYLDQQVYLLINARVKGGNSGGPVVNRYGAVVGIVTQLPAEAEGRADVLGYGAAIPTNVLQQFIQECLNEQSADIREVPFQVTSDGFSTKLR